MKRKIRLNHIIFFAVAIVAVISLLFFWHICNQRVFDVITDRVVEDYAQTIMAVRKNVETLISYTEDFSKYLSLDGQVQHLMEKRNHQTETDRIRSEIESRREWEEINTRLIYATSRLAGFGIYTDGTLLYSYYNSSVSYDLDIIPEADLERAKRQKEPLWTGLMMLRSTGSLSHREEPVYSVLKYVQNDLGRHLGTIALFVRETSFSDILSNTEDTRNSQLYLVNRDGAVISSAQKDCLYRNAAEVLGLTEAEYRSCLGEERFLVKSVGDTPVLYMTCQIQDSPFRLAGRVALDDLRVQRRELRTFMMAMLFLTLATAIAASWFVSMQVARPIKQIISVMRRIEDRHNSEKLRCSVSGIEEINQLGLEFNRLMDEVDASAEQIYQEQKQRRHNEIKLLQAQIVPHFLYNTLGMISSFINLNRSKDAQDAIQNLAGFYRRSLSGGNERIPLSEEIELTRSYLSLQRMRYIEYIDYSIVHDERTGHFIVPKLLIQPLVENVLNHGLRVNGPKCLINIETRYDAENGCCQISVRDTGRGMSAGRLEQIRESLKSESSLTDSFGLLNVYQRMKLVYADRFSMRIDSEEGKYTVFLLTIRDDPGGEEDRHV